MECFKELNTKLIMKTTLIYLCLILSVSCSHALQAQRGDIVSCVAPPDSPIPEVMLMQLRI